jgi:hypothetical protein
VAVAALGLGIAALIIALTRPDRTEPGRRVDVGVSSDFALDQPVLFPDDDLYVVKVNDGAGILRSCARLRSPLGAGSHVRRAGDERAGAARRIQ